MRLPCFALIALFVGCRGSELAAPPRPAEAVTKEAPGFGTLGPEGDRVVGGLGLFVLPQPPSVCLADTPSLCLSAVYGLRRVNDLPLPVRSPWGVGEWDYDADAGTWMLVDATLSLSTDGSYSDAVTHRAASGDTIKWLERGVYQATSDSIHFTGEEGGRWSAAISGNGLTVRWIDGRTFTYER